MAEKELAKYLNDHLAGSVVALELLEHLKSAYADTPVEQFVTQLHADISSDQKELERLMERLEVAQSRTRSAAGWLAEKATQLKLLLDEPQAGAFRLLESMELLSIGIEGKQALWRALQFSSDEIPALRDCEYSRLIQRAVEQRERVEDVRLKAAKAAFSPEPVLRS